MNLGTVLTDEILPRVERPSRYLGTELNAVHKDPAHVEVRIALAFPDLYDIGLGNLGLHILYAVLNERPWVGCERAYAPALDLESELRARGLPLFALESKDSLADFDLLGFTLQSELTFTNILNMLDLTGLPLRTADRAEDAPLTCAGGPAVFNPEPLAPFLDFFVIGDGEDAVVEIAEVLRATRGQSRAARLAALAELEGIYVPALYPFETLDDGRVLPVEGAPPIRKRITRDLDGATFPTNYIVPFTQQVHDRVSLEVLRGCTQGCRFCQAGMTTRPVRERSLEKIDELMERTLANTGYEEVSLVSLSTCDYSRVRQLVQNTVERARPGRVSVSLPSLRLDSFSVELADMVAETRRTGLTVAPEAASPRLRSVINKWIPDDDLLRMMTGAYQRGWGHVKLYFMIGLPTERDDDVVAIADLARRAVEEGRAIRPSARVNLGVSTFVPKPFTPFQWAEQIGASEISRRQDLLARALGRHKAIKFGRHEPDETLLEGLVSRADRRAADLLEAAWRLGCRFDAWSEHRRMDLWQQAIDEVGYDVAGALRARGLDERLPWDHIDVLIPKGWLQADWKRALELEHAEDCRHRKCHKCGVIDTERPLCAQMLRDHVKARPVEAAWTRGTVPALDPGTAVQRLWFRVGRSGSARFLSHLETMNAWLRALRRARAPLLYSQGFHPHPRVAFSAALPLGEESDGEIMDLVLTEEVDPAALLEVLRGVLPEGFEVHDVSIAGRKTPSLMSLNHGARYDLDVPAELASEVRDRAAELLAADRIEVIRKAKRKRRRGPRPTQQVDIRPMIAALELRDAPDGGLAAQLVLQAVDGKPGKLKEVLPRLCGQPERLRAVKRATLTRTPLGGLASLWTDVAPGPEQPGLTASVASPSFPASAAPARARPPLEETQ